MKMKKPLFEEITISELDQNSLTEIKRNFKFRLGEYKTYILSNIVVDEPSGEVILKNFESIDIKVILRELNNEFTPEVVEELNVESFLRKLNQILELKKRNIKRKIREAFDEYYTSIDQRIDQLNSGESEDRFDEFEGEDSLLGRKQYYSEKYKIQIELLKLQEWAAKEGKRIAIVFEGRDAAGKGSTIKRFIEYLNPRGFKVVALGIPTEEEKKNWFGRYEKYLPKPGEIVFFDRSWYNRAVVEPALGYCSERQYKEFMDNVVNWEENLIGEGLILIKFWFSISQEKQIKRFELRKASPLKYWKFSPNDEKVLDKWDIIGKFKNQMFLKTSSEMSPWVVINSNDKKIGRLNAMRYVISSIDYDGKDSEVGKWYPEVVNVIK